MKTFLLGKDLAPLIDVTPPTLSETARAGRPCKGYDVPQWSVWEGDRIVGYEVPPEVLSSLQARSVEARENPAGAELGHKPPSSAGEVPVSGTGEAGGSAPAPQERPWPSEASPAWALTAARIGERFVETDTARQVMLTGAVSETTRQVYTTALTYQTPQAQHAGMSISTALLVGLPALACAMVGKAVADDLKGDPWLQAFVYLASLGCGVFLSRLACRHFQPSAYQTYALPQHEPQQIAAPPATQDPLSGAEAGPYDHLLHNLYASSSDGHAAQDPPVITNPAPAY